VRFSRGNVDSQEARTYFEAALMRDPDYEPAKQALETIPPAS